MFRVLASQTKVNIRNQSEIENLVSYLRSKGYPAMIRGMVTNIFSLVKLPEPHEDLLTKVLAGSTRLRYSYARRPGEFLGDLFITDDMLYVLNHVRIGLRTAVIGYEKREEALQKFCVDIEEGIKTTFNGRRVRGMKFKWQPLDSLYSRTFRHRYPAFEEFFEEEPEHEIMKSRPSKPSYNSRDIEAANLLVNSDIRQFMLKLAQVRKMIKKDAINVAKKSDAIEQLLLLGLIQEEYLLTCKQDQHTICVIAHKNYLTQEPMISSRCDVCERTLSEENLQVIYTPTERGKRLIDGSLWMVIWITELLAENGINKQNIKWGLEANGEELDIMVEDFDSRLFFELKDREFGLGDAYPFTYRISRYEGKMGIVVIMDKVSADAKRFLEGENVRRDNPIVIQYLESRENIQKGINKIVEESALSQAHRVITPFSLRMGFEFWPIIEHWVKAQTK